MNLRLNEIVPESISETIATQTGGENVRTCLTCAQCASRCFLADMYPEMNPRKLVRKVLMGRGQEIVDSQFLWACTLCGRCTTDCPKEINMDVIVRNLRGLAHYQGKGPQRLEAGLANIREFRNNVGMPSEEFIETVEWLAEEVMEEVEGLEDEDLSVPIDKEGAEILYVPNPREYTSNPQMFGVYLKFFLATHADWTLSSTAFDITNWGYYMGDEEVNMITVRTMVDEARRLGVKTLLSTECGHGFKIMRKDAERMIGEPLGFEIISIVELAHRYFKEGRLRLRQGSIDEPVTYHDPCNVGRKVGIFDPPRDLLKFIAKEFVEMWPNRKYSLCCGGGGSVLQNSDMGQKRMEAAKLKQRQILETGAAIVSTSCQNCLSQIQDIRDKYDMHVEVKSVMELVVAALDD
jgi:Fe-S oxidoreductase